MVPDGTFPSGKHEPDSAIPSLSVQYIYLNRWKINAPDNLYPYSGRTCRRGREIQLPLLAASGADVEDRGARGRLGMRVQPPCPLHRKAGRGSTTEHPRPPKTDARGFSRTGEEDAEHRAFRFTVVDKGLIYKRRCKGSFFCPPDRRVFTARHTRRSCRCQIACIALVSVIFDYESK